MNKRRSQTSTFTRQNPISRGQRSRPAFNNFSLEKFARSLNQFESTIWFLMSYLRGKGGRKTKGNKRQFAISENRWRKKWNEYRSLVHQLFPRRPNEIRNFIISFPNSVDRESELHEEEFNQHWGKRNRFKFRDIYIFFRRQKLIVVRRC